MTPPLRRKPRVARAAGISTIFLGVALTALAATPASAEEPETVDVGVTLTVPVAASTPTPTPTPTRPPTPAPSNSATPPPAADGGTNSPALPPTGMSPWVWTAAWVGGGLIVTGAGALVISRRIGFDGVAA